MFKIKHNAVVLLVVTLLMTFSSMPEAQARGRHRSHDSHHSRGHRHIHSEHCSHHHPFRSGYRPYRARPRPVVVVRDYYYPPCSYGTLIYDDWNDEYFCKMPRRYRGTSVEFSITSGWGRSYRW